MISGRVDGPHARALQERLLQLLADAGVPADDAARGAQLLIVDVLGSIAVELTDRSQAGQPPRAIDRLSPPRRTLSDASTEQYLWGLHRLLDGITATTAAASESVTS